MKLYLAPDGRRSRRWDDDECPNCRRVREWLAEERAWLGIELWGLEVGMLGQALDFLTNGWWCRRMLGKPDPRRKGSKP